MLFAGLPPPPGKGPAAALPTSPLQLCVSPGRLPLARRGASSPSPFPFPSGVITNNRPPLAIRL